MGTMKAVMSLDCWCMIEMTIIIPGYETRLTLQMGAQIKLAVHAVNYLVHVCIAGCDF